MAYLHRHLTRSIYIREAVLVLVKNYSNQRNYRDPIDQSENWDPERSRRYSRAIATMNSVCLTIEELHAATLDDVKLP